MARPTALVCASSQLSSTKARISYSLSSCWSCTCALYATSENVPMTTRQATVMPTAAKDMNPCENMLRMPSPKK